ncbi:SPOR domain-containing protein [Maridesulfovibrio bastinii]|uniref:SPOR domain-containing protein n=1 Tax=Maridesulfovibrio bastinii TaxID=47157 RepID=UPI000411E22C|nr:SPOR domain-containing protein [Maridesulfovibrio bastinii]
MANKKTKPAKGPKEEKIYTFNFNLPSLIGLCAGAVVALCAFFVLGVLLGRGYQPEKDVPELAMVMPSQSENKTEGIKGGVLKPEELRYMDDLKKNPVPVNKEEREKIREEDREKAAAAQKKKEEREAERDRRIAERKARKEARQEAAKAKTPAKAPKPAVAAAEAGAPVYDYVYQIASFLDEAKAAGFAGNLQKDSLNAYVESAASGSKTYYRVFVKYTGTAESTAGMKSVVAKYGIKKPLLRSKVEK